MHRSDQKGISHPRVNGSIINKAAKLKSDTSKLDKSSWRGVLDTTLCDKGCQ